MRWLSLLVLVLASCADDPVDDDVDVIDESLARTPKVLRGVDRAGAFTVHEAKILKRDHGVRWTGVYIGGACNAGSGWTRHGLAAIHQATNWRFMPIWVGQQSSAICGAHTLTFARGQADGHAAADRMREFGWRPDRDIPVALDVEGGTYESSPHAATAYVHGFVRAVHTEGYRAYVYSSELGIEHFHDARIGVDGAWVASWIAHGFLHTSPDHLHLGARYRHHNRAWQYAGDFFVSRVGNVDANTADLLLAPPPGGTNRPRVASREVPAACGALAPGEGLVRGERVGSCDGRSALVLGDDGDLALVVDGAVTWSSGTTGAGATAVLEDTGELVVFDGDGEPVFTTDTGGTPDARLVFDARGLALDDADGAPAWTAATRDTP